MAARTIKGITVEIGGDKTGLGAALKDLEKESDSLNSSLKAVNKALELDPTNTELLAEKQKLLASSVEKTSEKLRILEDVQDQVKKQYADDKIGQAAYIDFQKEIVYTTDKLKRLEKAAENAGDEIDESGDEAKRTAGKLDDLAKAAKESEEFGQKLGDTFKGAVVSGFKAAAGAVAAAAGALVAAEEGTRDYRTEQQKLVTAFAESNFVAETAKNTYSEIMGILGESDQAVEAANHLAKLTREEEMLAQWTGDILPGVFSVFGDSLPIEGLTEAANETAKVGAVTGSLADALNWAAAEGLDFGLTLKENISFTEKSAKELENMSDAQKAEYEARKEQYEAIENYNKRLIEAVSAEDKFNLALENCSTEQERSKLITETLVGLYGDASAAYKQNAADIIAANQANDKLTASTAALGEVVSPLITDVKNLAAGFLEDLVPAVSSGVEWIYEAVDEFNEFWPRFLSNAETNYEETGSYLVDTTQITMDDMLDGFRAGWNLIDEVSSGFRSRLETNYGLTGDFLVNETGLTMADLKAGFSAGWDAVDAVTSGKLSALRDSVDSWMGKAKTAVSDAIEGIKDLFDFEWSWPEISIPGVSISDVPIGNFSGTDIKWNAEGAILRGAQIFGKLGDTYLGGAEAGDEALLPLSSFYQELESILTRNNPGVSGLVVQVNVEHFENRTEQDLDELSEAVADKISFNIQREAVFA